MTPSEIAEWPVAEVTSFDKVETIQTKCPTMKLSTEIPTSPAVMSPQKRRFSQTNANTRNLAQSMIGHALQTYIENINPDECEAGGEDAFFVADLGEIYRQHMRWKVNLPRVEPFYGMSFRSVHPCGIFPFFSAYVIIIPRVMY